MPFSKFNHYIQDEVLLNTDVIADNEATHDLLSFHILALFGGAATALPTASSTYSPLSGTVNTSSPPGGSCAVVTVGGSNQAVVVAGRLCDDCTTLSTTYNVPTNGLGVTRTDGIYIMYGHAQVNGASRTIQPVNSAPSTTTVYQDSDTCIFAYVVGTPNQSGLAPTGFTLFAQLVIPNAGAPTNGVLATGVTAGSGSTGIVIPTMASYLAAAVGLGGGASNTVTINNHTDTAFTFSPSPGLAIGVNAGSNPTPLALTVQDDLIIRGNEFQQTYTSHYQDVVRTDGPTHLYSLDGLTTTGTGGTFGTIFDIIGRGNFGVATNGLPNGNVANITPAQASLVGGNGNAGAIKTNASNAIIKVPCFNPTGSFSVEFWVKPTGNSFSAQGPGFLELVGNSTHSPVNADTNVRGFQVYYDVTGGALDFVVGSGTTSSPVCSWTNTMPTSTVVHVVGTFDHVNNLTTLYTNSVLRQQTTYTGNVVDPLRPITIGINPFTLNTGQSTAIWDEFALYNFPLTQAQVTAHYTAGTSGAANPATAIVQTSITSGIGVPSGAVTNSSIYLRTDGTTGTRIYVYNGTAWVALAGI